ncbi:MAG: zinc-binding dehydrogenase [Thermoleophilia bacterium]|nr:zinc-binding dehydrogenase [Thermoleophilia bacterium]
MWCPDRLRSRGEDRPRRGRRTHRRDRAGGVGLNSIQASAIAGAASTVAVDLDASKLEVARQFGATQAFSPNNGDVRDAVLGLTEGRGADYVFVTVGSVSAMESGMELLRRGGDLVVVGMTPTGVDIDA